jgi:hypothetical protein
MLPAQHHCLACGRVVDAVCAPADNKRFAVGYKVGGKRCALAGRQG